MPDQPTPLPQAGTGLANVAFQTLQGAGGCKTPQFFASIPFDRSTGFNSKGFGMDNLNKDGFDSNGFDIHGFDKNGANLNGYNREGKFVSGCVPLWSPPEEES